MGHNNNNLRAGNPNHNLEPKQANLMQWLIARAHLCLCNSTGHYFAEALLLHPESRAAKDKCDCFKETQPSQRFFFSFGVTS